MIFTPIKQQQKMFCRNVWATVKLWNFYQVQKLQKAALVLWPFWCINVFAREQKLDLDLQRGSEVLYIPQMTGHGIQ